MTVALPSHVKLMFRPRPNGAFELALNSFGPCMHSRPEHRIPVSRRRVECSGAPSLPKRRLASP